MRVLSIDDSLLPTNVAVRKRCNVFWKRCSMFQKLCNVFQKNVGMRSNNAEMRSWIRCGLNLVHPRFSFILYNFGFTYMLFSRFRIYFWGGGIVFCGFLGLAATLCFFARRPMFKCAICLLSIFIYFVYLGRGDGDDRGTSGNLAMCTKNAAMCSMNVAM